MTARTTEERLTAAQAAMDRIEKLVMELLGIDELRPLEKFT